MKRPNIHVLIAAALAATAFFAFTSVAGAAETPDQWITARVKIQLFETDEVDADDINVDTRDGVVTLHGTVDSDTEKQRAERAAKQVNSVKQVRNLLQVVTDERKQQITSTDQQIKDELGKQLERDPQLENVQIGSVNNGVVLLKGEVVNTAALLDALRTARQVPGVRRVINQIRAPERLGDEEMGAAGGAQHGTERAPGERSTQNRPGQTRTDTRGEQRHTTAADISITSRAKLRLMADEKVPALDVNVDTKNGVVSLFGTVPSEEAKRAAEDDVRKVDGVRQVNNRLSVAPDTTRRQPVAVKDDDLEQRIEQVFTRSQDFTKVDVDVQNGVVRLTGEVPSNAAKLRAATLSRSQQGVRAVNGEDLRVQGGQDRGG